MALNNYFIIDINHRHMYLHCTNHIYSFMMQSEDLCFAKKARAMFELTKHMLNKWKMYHLIIKPIAFFAKSVSLDGCKE